MQVLDLESLFRSADFFREDLACLLKSVQTQEQQKLQLVLFTFWVDVSLFLQLINQ